MFLKKFIKKRIQPLYKSKKSKVGQDVLDKLNNYLNAVEPEAVYWLAHIWNDQQQAITYKELRMAIQNGYMNEKTLQDWQEDYAKFVNEKLKPIWEDAMKGAAESVASKYPDYFFDATSPAVRQWVVGRGAQWVTNIGDEQRQAIAVMIAKAQAGDFTADELSRAIRPCIGLTKQQATANLKYYEHVKNALIEAHPKMKLEAAEKKAQEAAQKYAARQHRYRAHTIATTELAFAYNKGTHESVKQAQLEGLMGKIAKIWSTAFDERVCPVCSALDGKTIGMEESYALGGKELFPGAHQTPPAHPRCRCAVEYEETEPPEFKSVADPPLEEWNKKDQVPEKELSEPGSAAVPPSMKVSTELKHNGKVGPGGTGEIHSYTDIAGDEWLFKPAQSKSGTPEHFRAHVQEAGYKIQGIVDPESAIEVGIGELGGKFGAIQKRVKNIDSSVNLKSWQHSAGSIRKEFVPQLQREHVTDWLLGNFDAHGGNFVIDEGGQLIGLDKEQAFRYIKDVKSHKMSFTYHPNASYGETEPIYNTLYRHFADKQIDMNLQDVLPFIKRVEAVPEEKYREIFRGYAESLKGKGEAAEQLLDVIVERKSSLRETYRTFYSDLLTVRTGKKQNFIFADESPAHIKQPLAATMHDKASLQKMNMVELKQLAKQKGIPYYSSMHKAQLIACNMDPVEAVKISGQFRDRLRAAKKAQRQTVTQPKSRDFLLAEDMFKDFSTIPQDKIGIAVRSDRGSVESLNLTARKMNIAGEAVYEISGKLTHGKWSSTWDKIKPSGQVGSLEFEKSDLRKKLFSEQKIELKTSLRSIKVKDGASSYEMYIDGSHSQYAGWKGFFRVRVPATGSGVVDAMNAKNLLQKLDLNEILENPDGYSQDTLKKMRLIWQNAPRRVHELEGLTGRQLDDKLEMIMNESKIDKRRIQRMKTEKVFEGYADFVESGIAEEYKKAGLEYIWSGVSDAKGVVKILQGPGMAATNTRCRMGMPLGGASPVADFQSGGSDNVFCRLGVKADNKPQFSNCYKGSGYRIIIDPKELERSDWYAYTSDEFGKTESSLMASRLPVIDFIKKMKHHYAAGNEIMFRQGIPKTSFTGIVCETPSMRANLIHELKQAGFADINGVEFANFIKVGTYI